MKERGNIPGIDEGGKNLPGIDEGGKNIPGIDEGGAGNAWNR